jgi:hypothetical protein
MSNWFIEPLKGKYYGTRVTNGDAVVEVWTGYTGKVSQRELDDGWTEEYGFDHVESDKDYNIACVICEALNNMGETK